MPPRSRPPPATHNRMASLTKAECDIALLAAQALTNAEIGQRLYISPAPPKCTSPMSSPSSASRLANSFPGKGSQETKPAFAPT